MPHLPPTHPPAHRRRQQWQAPRTACHCHCLMTPALESRPLRAAPMLAAAHTAGWRSCVLAQQRDAVNPTRVRLRKEGRIRRRSRLVVTALMASMAVVQRL